MWRPTGDRVLVRMDVAREKVTAGGVILAGDVETGEPIRTVDVVAVGGEVREVETGQRVLMSAYSGSTVDEAEGLRIVREDELMAVVENGVIANLRDAGVDEYEISHIDGYMRCPDVVPPGSGPSGDGFTVADIAELAYLSVRHGDYAETDIDMVGRLGDGRWFSFNAWCDTTGWDCQAGGNASVAASREDIERFGLTDEQRRTLGVVL